MPALYYAAACQTDFPCSATRDEIGQRTRHPPFSWPGGSMVVDYDGRILAQADAGPGEKVVVAPIDLAALRYERQRRIGHNTRAHLRSEIHTYLSRPHLPPALAGEHPLTDETIRGRIQTGRDRCRPRRRDG